jgi:hypothetical protein
MAGHTNTASAQGANERNCANCSAAGAVRMITHKAVTSGHAARGTPDDKPDAQKVGGIDGQLQLIEDFVGNETGRRAQWFGSAQQEMGYNETLHWMLARPGSTVFVVYASGQVVNPGVAKVGGRRGGIKVVAGGLDLNAGSFVTTDIETRNETKSHFLNARLDGLNLNFFDHQTDVGQGGRGVTRGNVPFLGILTDVGNVTVNHPGAFKPNTRLVVLAFSPAEWVGAVEGPNVRRGPITIGQRGRR